MKWKISDIDAAMGMLNAIDYLLYSDTDTITVLIVNCILAERKHVLREIEANESQRHRHDNRVDRDPESDWRS
jgi:hypothetical protein